MRFLNFFFFLISTVLRILTTSTQAATFEIQNNRAYTVWAAATPGGGRRLSTGQAWTVDVTATTAGQTGRNTNGTGSCQTGDCGGLLRCTVDGVHAPPVTLAEYSLNGFNNQDFLDISLLYGFNVPMEFSRPFIGCTGGIRCAADIKGHCPPELRAPGGCNNPCTVFNTGGYCCTSSLTCERTYLARFFKDMCPSALSYPTDDQSSIFTCPGGGNYRVVFCP